MSPAPPPVIVVARDLTSADTIVTPASAELLGLAGTFATTSWESWTAPTLEPETVELATVALPVIATEAVPPTVHDMPTEVLATTDLDHNHLEATPAETFFAEPLNSLAAEAPLALTTLLGGDPGATMVAARFTLAEHDDQQHAELSGQTGPLALPETAEPVTGSAAGRRDEAGAMDDTALLVAPATLAEPAAEHTFAAPSPTVDEAAAAPAEHAPAAPLEMADQETAAAFAQANDASAPLLAADAAALTSPARAAEAAAPPVLLVPTAAPGNAEPAVGRDVPAPPADAPLEVATPFSAATFVAEPQVAPTSAALLVTVAALAETPTSEGAMLAEPLASRPIAEQPSVNEQEADEADEAQVPVPAPRADDAERATVAHDAEPVLMEPSAAAITREPLLDEPIFVESPPPDAALALAAAPAVAALTEFAIAPGADRADVDDPTPVMVAEEAQAAPDEPAALVTMLSADAGGSTTPEDETPLVEPRAQDTPSAPAAVEPVVANVPDEPGRAEPMLAEQPFLEEIPEEGSAAPNSFADSDDSSALDGSAFAEQTMIAEMETEHPLSAQGSGNEAADEVPVRGAMQAAEAVAAATPFAMEEAPGAEEVPLAESDPHAGAAPASSAPEPTPATLPQRSGNTVVMPPTQRADYMARHQAAWVEAGDLNGFAGVQLVVVSEEDSAEFAAPSVPANGVHMMGEPADSSAAQALAPNHFATDATAAGPVTFDLADLAGLAHLASAGVTDAGGALVPEVTSIPEDSAGSTAVSTSESTPAIANTDLSTPAATETPPGLRTRTPTRPMPRLERDITDPPHEW